MPLERGYHPQIDKLTHSSTTLPRNHVRPKPEQAWTMRGPSPRHSAAIASRLGVRGDIQHSAKELCESDTSHGSAFFYIPEKLFYDTKTRHFWLSCDDEVDEDQTLCFDLNAKHLRDIGLVGREIGGLGYSKVTE
jgi:hypothetical protein